MCSHSTCLLKECLHFHGGTVRRGWPYVSHLIPHSSLESESLVLTARWSVATPNIKHCFDMETVSELRSACAIILKQIGIFLLHIVNKTPSATIYIAGSMSDFFFFCSSQHQQRFEERKLQWTVWYIHSVIVWQCSCEHMSFLPWKNLCI